MLLADGREASLWLDSPARFARTGAAMIGTADTVVDAARENRGLFRVWTPPRGSFALTPGMFSREPAGMPYVMMAPLAYELIDHGGTIELRAEVYDTVRTIQLNLTAPPPDEPASMLGYSVGKWEDGELVVLKRFDCQAAR